MRCRLARNASNSSAVCEELAQIFGLFAERLRDAPGARVLVRLAQTAKRIPEPLAARLTALVIQIDDPQFIGNDIACSLFDASHCSAKCANATAFASALEKRLQRYIDNPVAANNARSDLQERAAWWRMALSKAGELSRWPALVLTNNMDNHNG